MKKKIQKLFYYSNEVTKSFIESRIEDIAIRTQRSSSYIIEDILLKSLLPSNQEIADIITAYLYTDSVNDGIRGTIDAILSLNAAGLGWKSKHKNLKPLVEYCLLFSKNNYVPIPPIDYMRYISAQLKDILDHMNNAITGCIELYDRKMYQSQYKLATQLYNDLNHCQSNNLPSRAYYQLIIDNFDILSNLSVTYRFLGSIVRLDSFQDTANARNKLFDVLNEISATW